jgi:CRP/FNR family transcriptional regulator/CRP/FNR family nitrogen fixation transcriptional regulator
MMIHLQQMWGVRIVLKALNNELALGRHLRRFRRGEAIYFEGDSAETWFEVTEGVARTCRFHADGHRQLTGFHYAGDVFGVGEQARLESAEAVTDVVCWCAAKRTNDSAAGASGYEQALVKALSSANRCIFLFGRRTAPQRIAAFLLMTAEQLHAQTEVELPMCRTDIADYLGLTIHTVSRTITQLCEDHLIALQGSQHCRILDRAGLMTLAGGQDWAPAAADRPCSAGDATTPPQRPDRRHGEFLA